MSYQELRERLETLNDLRGALSILGWDQETKMPKKAARARARQIGALSAIIHQRKTDPEMGRLLDDLDDEDLDDVAKVNVKEARRNYERSVKVPEAVVKELSETCSLANEAWQKAKATNDVSVFFPWLEKLIDLKQQEVSYRAPGRLVYDELLDDYEPGLKQHQVETLFEELKTWLIPFVKELRESPKQPNLDMVKRPLPTALQEKFGRQTIELMGFDFEAGRLDTSAHPFCGGQGPYDVRITTRYHEEDGLSSYFSFVHEAGHALYEQGLNTDHFGLPACSATSMAIHESQSRLWENCVARSRPYWEYMFPRLKECFGDLVADFEFEPFFHALNGVQPSLVRVDADEVTYNLHVILRFELERDLFSSALAVKDLEAAWNAKMKDYLGLTPPSASLGVLQDIHWAFAGFGYFPTYTYGNLYAAQMFNTLKQSEPDLDAHLRAGNFSPIRDWLREKVHKVGKLQSPAGLIKSMSGQALHQKFLIDDLEQKYRPLYGL